jgi:hypothetical protein
MKKVFVLRIYLVLAIAAVSFLVGCNRDPNVRKQKYFEGGQRFYEKAKYREAAHSIRECRTDRPTFR